MEMKRLAGGIAVALVIAGVVGSLVWKQTEKARTPEVINIIATKEAIAFCENPKVVDVFLKKHNRTLKCTQDSTGKIVARGAKDIVGIDVLLPASDVAARTYKGPKMGLEPAFPSQPVGFTKTEHAEAFVNAGFARKEADGSITLLVAKFVEAMDAGKTWKSIGIDGVGKLKIRTTDVKATSSGQGYVNLLAAVYNNGDPANLGNAEELGRKIKPHVERMGSLPMTSSELLQQCLMTGCFELNIGFENSYIRTARESTDNEKIMSQKLRIMYLEPGMWGYHTVIFLTENGKLFLEALKDPVLREIAWTDHGFRTGTTGITGDATKVPVKGIRPAVSAAISMATPEVNTMLINQVTQ